MRRFLAVVLILFACQAAFSQEAAADWYLDKPIKAIVFQGLKNIRANELDGTTAPFVGRPFTNELYLELQSRLYALDYFQSITPTALPADSGAASVVLQFDVVEFPIITRITFVGNSGLKRRELMDAVTIKVNDIANELLIRAEEDALRSKYREEGYADATVKSETRRAKDDFSVEVIFRISEGERTVVSDIFFEGNTVFSKSTLKGQLSLKSKGLIRQGAFEESKLLADRDAITRYYRDRGYLDAEVTDIVQDLSKDEKGNNTLAITFRIYEGRTYNFGGIDFAGNDIFTVDDLSKLVKSKKGEIANASKVEADLQRVADLYYENGYIYNTITNEQKRNAEEGSVAYTVNIVERGRAHIENIIVRGNEKTKEKVILREIPLEPGDVFSKTKVMEGYRNLMNLQFFSQVLPDPQPGSADSLMDLVINVEEQSTAEVQFGLTFSGSSDPDDFPISGLLSLSDRNFLGYGNTVKGEIQASPDTQSLTLQYSQRWLFSLPVSWGVDLTFSHAQKQAAMDNNPPVFYGNGDYDYPDGFFSYDDYYDASKIPDDEYLMEFSQWYISLGLSTTYRWYMPAGTLGLGGGVRTGVIHNKYDDLLRPFDPVIRNRNNLWTPVNSFWTLLYFDRRDLVYDPSKGYYASQRFSFNGVFPVENEHYIRSDTKAEYFLTLFDIPVTEKWNFKTVLALHSSLSFIFPQFGMDKPEVEDANKLYIDGMFIGRGWTDERIKSRGYALWENWVELRIPIVPSLLAWDFFFDADAAAYSLHPATEFFSEMTEKNWVFSLGGGLRFTIPQFPFRFLFAKRFRVTDGKVEWMKGNMGGGNSSNGGLDFVISFALTTY